MKTAPASLHPPPTGPLQQDQERQGLDGGHPQQGHEHPLAVRGPASRRMPARPRDRLHGQAAHRVRQEDGQGEER